MNYLDFDIEVGKGTGQDFPVRVLHSPAGEASETMRFPFTSQTLESALLKLDNALLRSGGTRRQVLSPEHQAAQDFGRALFDSLLTGEVCSRYDISLERARREDAGLRVRLRIEDPELAALPWEFLYDHRQAEYVCLTRDTPVVRYVQIPQPERPLAVEGALQVLGMIASPVDLQRLDVDDERRRVEMALASLSRAGLVEITWLDGQTWHVLQRAMRGGPWHIFHFIGHGGFSEVADEGLVYLADEDGRAKPLSAGELGRLLSSHRSLRLVFLNACEGARASRRDVFSSTSATLVRKGIPAVLAMQSTISELAAINLSNAFYEALADGYPVDAAVAEARVTVSLAIHNTMEWGVPVLYMRSADGELFRLGEKSLDQTQAADKHSADPHQPSQTGDTGTKASKHSRYLDPDCARTERSDSHVDLIVTEGCVVITIHDGKVARIIGSGRTPLLPGEEPSMEVSLRTRVEHLIVHGLRTKDDKMIRSMELTVFHRVDLGSEEDQLVRDGVYAYNPEILLTKVWSPSGTDWRQSVRSITDRRTVNLAGRYSRDELMPGSDLQDEFRRDLYTNIDGILRHLGVACVALDIGRVEVDD